MEEIYIRISRMRKETVSAVRQFRRDTDRDVRICAGAAGTVRTPVHLLFINLLTDSRPAIALGLEPHSRDLMDEKPRPADGSILTKDFLLLE